MYAIFDFAILRPWICYLSGLFGFKLDIDVDTVILFRWFRISLLIYRTSSMRGLCILELNHLEDLQYDFEIIHTFNGDV